MPTSQIIVADRVKSIDQRLQTQLQRCLAMETEAEALTREHKNIDSITRGLFVTDLIYEARGKLVECQMVAGDLATRGDLAVAYLAITERWVAGAIDLLNRAGMVLDFQQDIFGKALPTGGLWDK